jgi:hypothetical protein
VVRREAGADGVAVVRWTMVNDAFRLSGAHSSIVARETMHTRTLATHPKRNTFV